MEETVYKPVNHVRFVTAASLFDGHDAAINIMRRILQSSGAEVIHLGHNRSVSDVVSTAIQEDVQGIAISSYQGGHMEYFKYMCDLLRERGSSHIRVFGGGGGVIVLSEIRELEEYGVAKIFSPEDGMSLGLQGMINYMLQTCDFPLSNQGEGESADALKRRDSTAVARALTVIESPSPVGKGVVVSVGDASGRREAGGDGFAVPLDASGRAGRSGEAVAPVIGITGTGGAGKSTLTDELVRRFLYDFEDLEIAVLSVDPTRARTGGALLGDRIRMNALYGRGGDRVYMRSFATREANRATSSALRHAVRLCRDVGFDLVILETAGIGQSDVEVSELSDLSLYVMTQEFGAPTQLEKIGMLDVADFVAINKFERRGSEDALRDVRKQVQRNRGEWNSPVESMSVYPTMAARFNDVGVTRLYLGLLEALNRRLEFGRESRTQDKEPVETVIGPSANLRGTLRSDGGIRIDGAFEGVIEAF
ncbi:MAG: cobalamin-dependent protein, partial [Rhodothermales bacterium]|nr:cobalamin-dependent protein [Rhodothermales bacterium]